MNSQEMLILFIGVVLAATIVVTSLYSAVQKGADQAQTVSDTVRRSTMKEYSIVEVYRGSSETNIYVRGEFGTLNPANTVVIVNGIAYTPTVDFIHDGGNANLLDPSDLLLIRVPRETTDTDCIKIGIDGVYTTLGVC